MFLTRDLIQSIEAGIGRDIPLFAPELIVCGGIVLLLLLRLFTILDRVHLGWIALVVTLGGLAVGIAQWQGATLPSSQTLFGGFVVFDGFTVFLRMFLLAFTALTILLTLLTGIPDREDSADFYSLLLGAIVGMMLMSSASHLLLVYIGVEMASVPSYALAGFLKGKRQSSEAALKYVVYGGGASAVMLYGISLLAGKFGTAYLPDVAHLMAVELTVRNGIEPVLLLGTLFIMVGIAFKLSAVPFHFWCPDVFEGASAEVAGFLSVASKGAALALFTRVLLYLTGLAGVPAANYDQWLHVVRYLAPAVAFFAALTATFGNLAAYMQTNLKRLLAYSTIAHAGYMMMGLAPLNKEGAAAVLFYLVAYLFMNLGAFAIVAFLRNQTGSEDLSSFRGLVRRSPWMVVTFAVFLLSLLGMPPLVGFAAKFQVFRVLFDAGQSYTAAGQPGLGATMYALLVIGGINTVISVVYYVKVLKVMILDKSVEEVEGQPAVPLAEPFGPRTYGVVLSLAILVLGILWNPIALATDRGVESFHQAPRPAIKGMAQANTEGQLRE